MAPGNGPVEVVVLGEPPPAERRGAPRQASGLVSLVRAEGPAKALARRALVRDVSATGVGLLLDWHYPPGTLLAVAPLGWVVPRILVARVIRTGPEGPGWVHGCELTEPLGGAELLHWRKGLWDGQAGPASPPPSPPERS
jgi:hypothetical protein